jgi:hypothetical protein
MLSLPRIFATTRYWWRMGYNVKLSISCTYPSGELDKIECFPRRTRARKRALENFSFELVATGFAIPRCNRSGPGTASVRLPNGVRSVTGAVDRRTQGRSKGVARGVHVPSAIPERGAEMKILHLMLKITTVNVYFVYEIINILHIN